MPYCESCFSIARDLRPIFTRNFYDMHSKACKINVESMEEVRYRRLQRKSKRNPNEVMASLSVVNKVDDFHIAWVSFVVTF